MVISNCEWVNGEFFKNERWAMRNSEWVKGEFLTAQ